MGPSNCCLRLKLPIICVIVLLFSLIIFEVSAFSITASIGRPYQGRLINGIPFPNQFQGYTLRDPERSYATPEAIGALLDAIDAVQEQYPDTCNLYFGDFSHAGGGWINMHRSHQNGRDADLGMYAKGNRPLDTFVPMNEEILDVPKTWCFIESLLRSQHVQYIFLDHRIQRLLHEYALSRGGDPFYLETLFGNNRGAIMQHVRGHYDHMHVRFYTPWSTMAARAEDENEQKRTAIEMAQQAYLPKQVNYYVKGNERGLEELAQSFGVNQKDLCRWNRMQLNDMLSPGACMVFYKRSFEVEPVHLARSLQPDSVPDSPGFQLASAHGAGALSDSRVAIRESGSRERKLSLTSPYIYTVHRGDTLDKVAKRSGMDIKDLCELNGLRPKAGVKPGQKIKLVSSKSSSSYADVSRSSAIKSVHAVSVADSKTLKGFAPVVYTAERNDTLPKIAKQRGIDLNTLCQMNGLSKNSTLKPGQKIQLSTQDAGERLPASSKAGNTSVRSASKRSNSARSTLQANMKPVADSKVKAAACSPQKSQGIQKVSTKSSTSRVGSTAVQTNVEKAPQKKAKK
jgi:LysM repeat protein/murein endopeptidase